MQHGIKYLIGIFLLLMLSGCISLGPTDAHEKHIYVLNKMPNCVDQGSSTGKVIVVTMPKATGLYASNKMAYSTQDYQIGYFAYNSWADTPARMLQPLIVQTLQKTHHYRAVIPTAFSGNHDYRLDVDLLKLEQEFCQCSSYIDFVARVQLVDVKNSKIIRAKTFMIHQPTQLNNPYGGVLAANDAVAIFLDELATFCVRNT